MKLLFLSPFLYHSKITHGGGVLSFHQMKLLAQRHDIHFLSFIFGESSEEIAFASAELGEMCKSVETVPLSLGTIKKISAKIRLLLRLDPIDAQLFVSQSMQKRLQEMIDRVSPDVVFIQFPQMAQYVKFTGRVATVLDVHDSFSVSSYRKFRAQAGGFQKIVKFSNWISWIFYESFYYPQFNTILALTEQDRSGLEIFSPGLGAIVSQAAVTLPEINTPIPQSANSIAFIGSFGHTPNVEGVQYFIEKIFPRILAENPSVQFVVAGKNVPEHLLAHASERIRFVGFVEDASVFMRSAAVIVVPLLSGGGVKIKTLEAMAAACPIVSTSIGAEETGAIHGEHLLIADDCESFATSVLHLMNAPNRGNQFGDKARTLIQERFSWQAKLSSLENAFQRALNKRRQQL